MNGAQFSISDCISEVEESMLERALEAARQRYGLVVAGYVLMPEHVHLLEETQ